MQPEDQSIEQLRGTAQILLAQDALRGIVILNGGAMIALLTFFGQAWAKNEAQAAFVMAQLRTSLILFVLGALSGVLAQGLAYLAQQLLAEERQVAGRRFRNVCICFAAAGMYFFAHGGIAAIDRFIGKI